MWLAFRQHKRLSELMTEIRASQELQYDLARGHCGYTRSTQSHSFVSSGCPPSQVRCASGNVSTNLRGDKGTGVLNAKFLRMYGSRFRQLRVHKAP